VFVHGYNVSFEEAARRTAQIHYDLQFKGVPIFYSWPSRANMRSYFFDRNEIQFSRQLIKQFLLDVAEKTGAERIHVIAHSMGADAVTQAISEFPEGQRVFDQIILAAADIDADVFKYQVVPRMVSKAQRVTLYCSRNDWALQASYLFNDSWRAGDSSRGLLVSQGLDTVDASSMDTELLGHSYYGNCLPLLRDVRLLIEENRQPQERDLQAITEVEALPVWTFAEARLGTPPGGTSTDGK
jgi:esterase/lipase superfamily enzyme